MRKSFILIMISLLYSCTTVPNHFACTEFLTNEWEIRKLPIDIETKLLPKLSFQVDHNNIIWYSNDKNQLGLCSPKSETIAVQALFEKSQKSNWVLLSENLFTTTSGSIR